MFTRSALFVILCLSTVYCQRSQNVGGSAVDTSIDTIFQTGGPETPAAPQQAGGNTLFLNQYTTVTQQKTLQTLSASERCGEGADAGVHLCVTYDRCDATTNTILPESESSVDPGLQIDIRAGEFDNSCHYLDVCCQIGNNTVAPPILLDDRVDPTPVVPVVPPVTPTPRPPVVTDVPVIPARPTPSPLNFCGIRNTNGVDFMLVNNTNNEAEYGEFPWMTAILKRNPQTDDSLALCGGAIITPRVIVTGAHCVYNYTVNDIKIRAGEWDTQTTRERLPYQERDIDQIIVHPEFDSRRLYNDVAVLVLTRNLDRAEHLGTVCLPHQGMEFRSQNCLATGWGKDRFGLAGNYQVILKKLELPMVPADVCQEALRNTRLSSTFNLHSSFNCAGGRKDVDTCTGDGGSPLVCLDPNNPGRYMLAGMVAWGIGCGSENVPGVYVNVGQFRLWIDQQLRKQAIETLPYEQ